MKKITIALLVGVSLALGGANVANADEGSASSPDISTPSESTTSPTTQPSVDASETSAPTGETGTPARESSDTPIPPTEATPSNPTSSESSTKPESSPPASETATVPVSAPATTIPEPTDPTPVEGWWAMPNGGTADNVTWPQPVADSTSLECGVWYQVDTYPSANVLAGLQADGILTQGEDYSTVISWRFVYGGDCPPAPGPANPGASIVTQCGVAVVTATNAGENILTASIVIYADGNFYKALAPAAGETLTETITFPEDSSDHVISVRTGPAFGDVELASATLSSDCVQPPVVTPPTETPQPTPVVTDTPITAAPAAAVTPTSEVPATLASTGSNEELHVWMVGGIVLVFGLLLVIFGRSRTSRLAARHQRQNRK